ncbi:MAG: long-chain fatty acid transporter [Methylotenera sp.]|nr:long-chain fatty acid transporter [Methylotenera sp.]
MKLKPLFFAIISTLTVAQAQATDGYFSHGYGVKAQGMGGAGIAFPQDSIAAATNPAGMGLIGERLDIGATWFRPQRETTITGNAFPGVDGKYDANDTENFIIPEFGYNRVITPEISLGVSVYGNGGMNTDYKKAIPLLGNTPAGIDMAQLFIAPTVAWKVTPNNTLGLSLNLAYQRFEAKGLQNFQNFSTHPNRVTNKGHDSSTGLGVRVGWIGQINEAISVGATYQSKTRMSKFNKYQGLFAESGDFDVPENYGIGIAVKPTSQLTLAADIEKINYSDVNSVGNLSLSNLFAGNALGSNKGSGFAWRDVTAVKLGANYIYNEQLTLRAGYNHSSQPIRSTETLFNVLAPGVVQDHLTFGASYTFANKSELSFAYMHAFEEKVRGNRSIPAGFPPAGFGGGNANLKMHEDSFGIAYSWQW